MHMLTINNFEFSIINNINIKQNCSVFITLKARNLVFR